MKGFIEDTWSDGILGKVVIISLILFIIFAIFGMYYTVEHDCECIKYGSPMYQKIGNIMYPIDNCIEMKCKD